MTTTEGPYLFSHTWEGEGDRLMALSSALDPTTRRQLAGVGVGDGWRCLEVGAGTGTIAAWLSEQVGPKGSVVATDISLALMEQRGLAADNLELRRHDILNDPLPDGEFDLIHSRLVLEHLPGREEALARMAQALAPGGWLVIEEITFGTERAVGRGGAVLSGLVQVIKLLMQRKGFDAKFGQRLPIHLARLGLTEIGAEGTQLVLIGGSESVDWAKPSLTRFRHLLFEDSAAAVLPGPVEKLFSAAPGLRRAAERRLDGLERLLADPEFVYLAPTFVSARGRRRPA
jgi:ubiquinone/menaquinone biosynthesis C-methylase UbiE